MARLKRIRIRFQKLMAWRHVRVGALGLAVVACGGLGACTATAPSVSEAQTAQPGVTVYGTVDAGVGRSAR